MNLKQTSSTKLFPIRRKSDQLKWVQKLAEACPEDIKFEETSEKILIEIRSISVNVPVDDFEPHVLGLIAKLHDPEYVGVYLCRQRFDHSKDGNKGRIDLDPEETFFRNYSELRYPKAVVTKYVQGKQPRSRIYHAVICLSEGRERIASDVENLIKRLPAS